MSDAQTVEQLTASLADLTDDQLAQLRQAEEAGEDRVTAIAAIDAEIKRRADGAAQSEAHAQANAQIQADAQAQAQGFADHAAKVEVEKSPASKKAKPKKSDAAAGAPTPEDVAKANARGLEDARAAIANDRGAELRVGFGDDRKPFKAIPFAEADIRQVGQRLLTGVDIVMRTGKLSGAVEVSHAWLMLGESPLMRSELGAPMGVQPNNQVKIAAGRLAFS